MHTPVSQVPLSALFTEAKTHNVWEPRDVSDEFAPLRDRIVLVELWIALERQHHRKLEHLIIN